MDLELQTHCCLDPGVAYIAARLTWNAYLTSILENSYMHTLDENRSYLHFENTDSILIWKQNGDLLGSNPTKKNPRPSYYAI